MIDIENDVFDAVASAVLAVEPSTYVTGVAEHAPPRFPCVVLSERSNTTLLSTRSSSAFENHAQVMFELDVYSNKVSGKKAQCKALAAVVDTQMQLMGFTRVMLEPIDNMLDPSVYRMKGRYQAVIGKNKTVYRR